jgi:hypothetical protein
MNRYECATEDRSSEPSIAVCVSCGAGVCAAHARVESRRIWHPASPGRPTVEHTRAMTCTACDAVLAPTGVASTRAGSDVSARA